MIRRATPDDMGELLRMGHAFHAAANLARWIEIDDATLARTFANLMGAETGLLLVYQTMRGLGGAVGALLHPHYMNADHLTGQELFWWVDPDQRGIGPALFDALESWVSDMGARTFTMIALENLRPEVVGTLYRRRGYEPAEHSFIRRF